MGDGDKILSISDYARYCGVDRSVIAGKIKRNVITEASLVRIEGKKIPHVNVALADADRAKNGDPVRTAAYATRRLKEAQKKNAESAGDLDDLPDTPPEESDEDNDGSPSFMDAKTDTEVLRSRKLRLEVEELEGRLLNAEDVRKTWVKLTTEAKTALLAIATKNAPVLVSISDPVEMETTLHREINQALESLSRLDDQ